MLEKCLGGAYGFLSGWNFLESWRYADFNSLSEAFLSTPRICLLSVSCHGESWEMGRETDLVVVLGAKSQLDKRQEDEDESSVEQHCATVCPKKGTYILKGENSGSGDQDCQARWKFRSGGGKREWVWE